MIINEAYLYGCCVYFKCKWLAINFFLCHQSLNAFTAHVII